MSPVKAELKDYQREFYAFRKRLTVGAVFFVLLFLLLLSRFVYLQVLQRDHYRTLAENNRISIVPIVPSRGLILDRNGVVLAHNFSAYTLEITPSKVKSLRKTIDALSKIVEITPLDRKRFKKLREESPRFESLPIRTRLNDVEVARFAVNRYRFPGVDIKARLFRHYPLGKAMAHVIGYIGRITNSDLDALNATGALSNYRGTEVIGKTGIERYYEKMLHGVTGLQQVETDAAGRPVRTLSRVAPVSGDNLYLTINSRLQIIANQAFGDNQGALVAIDPRNGEVLALVSKPEFDPNLFVDGIDTANWERLNNSPDHPLTDRALRGQYPPGSTFKPFVALAGLALHKITPKTTIVDPGYYMLPGNSHRYRDWKPGGHGLVDMRKAIQVSCDTYFYGLANTLGIDNLHRFIRQFGFGQKSGIDIDGELSGLLPSRQWKEKRFHQPWYPGETVITGIGQGYTLVTPLQLAVATGMLATDGTAYRPHVVKSYQDSRSDRLIQIKPVVRYHLSLKPADWNVVREGMEDVVHPGGTAVRAFRRAPYTVAAKTGTAQIVADTRLKNDHVDKIERRYRDHAVFIAYAPAETPRIAVAVIVEHGGHGGVTAAPIARKVMDYYLRSRPLAGLAHPPKDKPHD